MRGRVSTNDLILEGFINVDKKTNLETLNVTENGTYSADDIEADGWDEVIVNVPQSASNIDSLSVTANGTYNAPTGVDGYNPVLVNVPQETPNIDELIVHANGTYNAPTGVDGYNPVTVNVPGPVVDRLDTSINHNGTFNLTENKPYGVDYYDPVIVTVDVPEPVLIPKFINANGVYLASSDNADGFATVTVNVPVLPADCIIVENAKICDSIAPITVNFTTSLIQGESYLISFKDSAYNDASMNFKQYVSDQKIWMFLNKAGTDSAQVNFYQNSIYASFNSYHDRWVSIYKVPQMFYCQGNPA